MVIKKIWDIYSKVDKKSKLTFIFQVSGLFFGYSATYLIARFFGANTLGLYSISLGMLNVLVLFSTIGTQQSIVRFINQIKVEANFCLVKNLLNNIYSITLILAIIVGVLLYNLSSIISNEIFHKEKLIFFIKMVSIVIPFFTFLSINTGILRSINYPEKTILYKNAIIYFLVNILLLVFIYFRVINIYLPFFIHSLVIILISFIVIYDVYINLKKVKIEWSKKEPKISKIKENYTLKRILSISFPIFISGSINLLSNWINVFMIGSIRSEAEVGIYMTAFKTITATGIILMVLNTVAAAKIAEFFWSNRITDLLSYLKRNSKIIFWFSTPLILFLMIFASKILNIFGADFKKGAGTLVILGFGQIVNIACGQVGVFMNMTGLEKSYRNAILISLVLNIILNIILIPILGINGAAIANLVGLITWNLLAEFKVYKKHGFWIGYPIFVKQKRVKA